MSMEGYDEMVMKQYGSREGRTDDVGNTYYLLHSNTWTWQIYCRRT